MPGLIVEAGKIKRVGNHPISTASGTDCCCGPQCYLPAILCECSEIEGETPLTAYLTCADVETELGLEADETGYFMDPTTELCWAITNTAANEVETIPVDGELITDFLVQEDCESCCPPPCYVNLVTCCLDSGQAGISFTCDEWDQLVDDHSGDSGDYWIFDGRCYTPPARAEETEIPTYDLGDPADYEGKTNECGANCCCAGCPMGEEVSCPWPLAIQFTLTYSDLLDNACECDGEDAVCRQPPSVVTVCVMGTGCVCEDIEGVGSFPYCCDSAYPVVDTNSCPSLAECTIICNVGSEAPNEGLVRYTVSLIINTSTPCNGLDASCNEEGCNYFFEEAELTEDQPCADWCPSEPYIVNFRSDWLPACTCYDEVPVWHILGGVLAPVGVTGGTITGFVT